MKITKIRSFHRLLTHLFTLAVPAFLLISCSGHGRLTPEGARREFEKDSGFKIPASATAIEGLIGREDSHGDYSMVVTFVVPPGEVAAFTQLPKSVWLHPEDLKPLKATKNIARDISLPATPNYQMPAGALFIDQWGKENRRFALDPAAGRIIYARQTY